jgi:two-component system, cell cycle sensor histidine kinase and response regulator CckA
MTKPVDPSDEAHDTAEAEAPTRSDLPTDDAERLKLLAFASQSIAHDLNNLLMVIENSARALAQQAAAQDRPQADLILRTVRIASGLAQQLQNVGRPRQVQPRICDLNEVLTEALHVVRAVTGPDVEVQFQPGENVAPTFIDPVQIQEVLLNLGVNAREAMPTGGTLTLSTQTETISAGELDLEPGTYTRIHICDTGLGMDADAREHAFEPYFTTKHLVGNSGLGLATVREVLLRCRGSIRLSTNPGPGTCFDIYLPLLANAGTFPASAGQLVLLLEDSDELRRMLEDFLIAQGYRVIACACADEMVAQAQSASLDPQIIIADVLMPGISGADLVAQLRSAHPGLKSIFISGHSRSAEDMPGLPGDAQFLQKPFSLQALAATIEILLGHPVSHSGGPESI